MRHPIQRLHFCPSTSRLFAGVGGAVQCFHGTTGELIAEWTAPQLPVQAPSKKKAKEKEEEEEGASEGTSAHDAREGSPSKKRKVGEKAEPIRSSLLGVGAPRGEGENGRNSITKILAVKQGAYLVVVTNEDKTLRVFEVAAAADGGGGALKVLSERAMPKRPCALSIADGDSTILLADKFGDVYALPLLPPPTSSSTSPAAHTTAPRTPAQLAADEREALAEAKRKRTEITHDLPFSARLLLGHVSMLTDVLAVTLPHESGRSRTYILTADRDEHIRVSRYPQSYVIEVFCLRHTAFVSTLLAPSWDKTTLISGGGDDFLLRWDWQTGKAVQKVDVGGLVAGVVGGAVGGGKHDHGEKERAGGEKEFKVTVVGMWEVPERREIVVAFESVPALFVFTLGTEIVYTATLPLRGHPLDVAVDIASNVLYVSVAPEAGTQGPTMEKFANSMDQWENVTEGDEAVGRIAAKTAEVQFVGDEKVLNEGLLYATGLLRKGTGRAEREE